MLKKILAVTIAIVIVLCVLVPIIDSASIDGEESLDVVILAGQSNAAYTTGTPRVDPAVVNEEIPLPSTNCYYFGTESRPVYHSTNLESCKIWSMVNNGSWHIGGEEAPIAYEISKKTQDDVLIINTAIPGQPIADLTPTGEYGARIIATLDKALAMIPSHYNQIRCGWVWIQGEADKTTSLDDYVDSFHQIQDMYASYGFDKCYLVQTRPSDSGNATDAQNWLVKNDPDVIMSSTAPAGFSASDGTLVLGNEIHYTQKGRDIVGLDVGQAISKNLDTHFRDSPAPEILKIIPAIIILALVVFSAGAMIYKRND